MEKFHQTMFSVEKHTYWTQYMAVISATIISTMAGINFAWPSPSIPRLLKHETPFNISREEASYIAITAPIGCIVGGPVSAILVDLIGRRTTLLITALPQLASFIFIYCGASFNLPLLYFARFLGGIGEGVNFTITPMYIGEIAHPNIRGNLGGYISLTLRTGILLINVIGSFFTIKATALGFTVLPVIFLVTFLFMPETPYYHLMKNKPGKARDSLRFLRRKPDVEEELEKLTRDVRRQVSESGSLWDLIKIPTNRRALLIGIGLRTFQQFSGISAYSLYTQILFKEALDDISPITASIIYTVIQLLTTFLSAGIVDKTGRKPLLIFSCVACAFLLVTQATFIAIRDFHWFGVDDVSCVKWLPFAIMICFIVVFAAGMGTVVNIMLGELFSASVKAKALAILNVYFAITMTIATKFFQYMTDWLGLSIPFYVFAVWCAFGAIFCYREVPETKGKTLEEIQQSLKGGRSQNQVQAEEDTFL